jgi:hypothetical protein
MSWENTSATNFLELVKESQPKVVCARRGFCGIYNKKLLQKVKNFLVGIRNPAN